MVPLWVNVTTAVSVFSKINHEDQETLEDVEDTEEVVNADE